MDYGKDTFETHLTWSGGSVEARVVIGLDGYGEVYEKGSGLYCGSIDPIRARRMLQEAQAGGEKK